LILYFDRLYVHLTSILLAHPEIKAGYQGFGEKEDFKDLNASNDPLASSLYNSFIPARFQLDPQNPKKSARRPKDDRIVCIERVKCPAIPPPLLV
jgi:hypothetical protein